MSHFETDTKRENLRTRQVLRQALQNTDELVMEFEYRDSKGVRSRRVVSPIRFVSSDRFLGLCLSREEPRQFYLSGCSNAQLQNAGDYLMPLPMLTLESSAESTPTANELQSQV